MDMEHPECDNCGKELEKMQNVVLWEYVNPDYADVIQKREEEEGRDLTNSEISDVVENADGTWYCPDCASE